MFLAEAHGLTVDDILVIVLQADTLFQDSLLLLIQPKLQCLGCWLVGRDADGEELVDEHIFRSQLDFNDL